MTAADVDFIPVADALLRNPPLPHVVELTILGITTRFETNSGFVLGVVAEAFGAAARGGGAVRGPGERVRVRLVVREGGEPGAPDAHGHASVRHICPDATRLFVHSPGSMAMSDPVQREAVGYVSTALAADRAHFRAALLEAITFFLLTHLDRHPVHAAAVTRDGRAVLLAGPSGSGKSTLSYMAYRAGLALLSDDRVYVQLEPRLGVWGWPRELRLLPQAASTFPELSDRIPSWREGREKFVVPLSGPRAVAEPIHDVTLCLLERGAGAASLQRMSAGALAQSLAQGVDAGFDRFPARQNLVVRALAGRGGWRLRLSANPRDALPLIRRMLDDG